MAGAGTVAPMEPLPAFRALFFGPAGVVVLAQAGSEGMALAAMLTAQESVRCQHYTVDELPAMNSHGYRRWRTFTPLGELAGVLYVEPLGSAAAVAAHLLAGGYPAQDGWWVRDECGVTPQSSGV